MINISKDFKMQRTKIEFEIIKQRQTRIKCGFVSIFVLLEVTNSRIKSESLSLCNQLGIFYGYSNNAKTEKILRRSLPYDYLLPPIIIVIPFIH